MLIKWQLGFVIFAKAFEEYLEANKINFATCTPEEILKAYTIWPDQLTRELTELMKASFVINIFARINCNTLS